MIGQSVVGVGAVELLEEQPTLPLALVGRCRDEHLRVRPKLAAVTRPSCRVSKVLTAEEASSPFADAGRFVMMLITAKNALVP